MKQVFAVAVMTIPLEIFDPEEITPDDAQKSAAERGVFASDVLRAVADALESNSMNELIVVDSYIVDD